MAFFNPSRPSYVADPYPALHRLRDEDPVHFSRELDGWVLTRYDDCLQVLRDEERFSADPANARGRLGDHVRGVRSRSPMGNRPLFGQTDPPVHGRLRAIVQRIFTPRVVDAHRPRIRERVAELLDVVPVGVPFDFMPAIAERLPVMVINDLFGLDEDERREVRERARQVMLAASERLPDGLRREADASAAWLRDFLWRFAADHAGEDDRRLISILVEAEREADALSPDELLGFAVFLYSAGAGPTACLLGNGMAALLDHPEAAEALRADPGRLPAATDEMARFDSPTHVLIRVARVDGEIGRRRIAAGDALFLVVGAANRDPEMFADPDRFDPERDTANRNLAYGYGPHFCLGQPLARLQAVELFGELLRRFPSMEPAAGQRQHSDAFLLRGPRRLGMVAGA